ncbi:MAG: A/G-specific adenine glycosylase [Bacteroidota bacterium]|nr:A/G-specific adenine glycosylase [Bacteroidota bacterium]
MKKERALEINRQLINSGKDFTQKLLHWNRFKNNRQLPWKGEKDPYKIWLSEIILQQTRVEQGLKYYQNFIDTYKNVDALADAQDEKIFKLWEGLGYYSRCRNLIQTAQYISKELGGVFPTEYETILGLKGVGSYTAAAIVSFAYNLPHTVLDGNVFRVLSRIFNIAIPIDSTEGKKIFFQLAQQLLPLKKAGEYNQAVMDFGAVICKPVPLCNACFFKKKCLAYLGGKQDSLPVKEKKPTIKTRWMNYFIVQCGEEILIQQRTEKDIWQHLFQFILIETSRCMNTKTLLTLLEKQFGIKITSKITEWKEEQKLSHQIICFHFFHVTIKRKKDVLSYGWANIIELQNLAFPKTLQQAFQRISVAYWS